MNWHLVEIESALQELQTDRQRGLAASEAQDRLARYGPNALADKGGRTPFKILYELLTATMVLILIAAAIVAASLGDGENAIAIIAIVVLFTILGFIQDYRAERAIAALKHLSVPAARVLREGLSREIPFCDLVPGDLLYLESGDIIPADARLLEAVNLRIQEAALTGESAAVAKQTAALGGGSIALGDRSNMVYLGTSVIQGRGLGLVVATGMQTELGRIADLIQHTGAEQTPLQRRLDQLGRILAGAGFAVAVLIFVLGLLRGDSLRHLLLTAVSVAVAVVPEGLPAVVTITLALGAQRMLKRNALVRKLPAVETLGSVTVICSDKTGTLTENRMTVMVLDVADHALDMQGEIRRGSARISRSTLQNVESSLSLLAIGGALCNDARLVEEGGDHYHTIGDPTEGALVAATAQMGYWKSSLDTAFPRTAELPFDSERKRMTTVHQLKGYRPETLTGLDVGSKPYIAFTKGSVDSLVGLSSHVWAYGKAVAMGDSWRGRIEAANERLAKKGMRVLGVAFRLLDKVPDVLQTDLENNLTFVGLFGMIDPPRAEVRDAIALTRTAGIRTVMITGDHPLTAAEIARQLGISENGRVLTGAELDKLTSEELEAVVDDVCVYARVSPEHKLKIVQALQERGHVVAMTGDGVNDAPALRRAEVGVAMGVTGTDVSKEAADLVLLDDNFTTIVAAVQEGRTIYDNIRKFVRFSVAGNIGKVLVMLLAPFLGKPIPLLPLQLLWLNLLTDGLLGLGLGAEPAERDAMKRPPYSPREGVFSRGGGVHTAWVGGLIGALALGIGAWYFFGGHPAWQTMVFTSLAFAQIGQALASRSSRDSLFKVGLWSNPLLLDMALAVLVLQLLVVYLPPLQGFFSTQALRTVDLAVAFGVGLLVFGVIEIEKRVKGRKLQA
jgi:Ca2+-transporting ATPase